MKVDFKGKNIFVGLDVHKSSCEVKVLTDNLSIGNVVKLSPLSGLKIFNYLKKNYRNGNYSCVYEAGFSGFWLQRELSQLGVDCIVVNPADVPTTHKEKLNKNDKIDCVKLAKSLRSGDLKGIFIPSREQEIDRCLVRQRYKVSKELARVRNQIKSHLNLLGIKLSFVEGRSTHWSNPMVHQIYKNAEQRNDFALLGYLETMRVIRDQKLIATKRIRSLSKLERHKEDIARLTSIKGVGVISAMIIRTELIDISRFSSFDCLQSYVGLIPNQRASGDSDSKGSLTSRANSFLRPALIQCAWSAVRYNPEMAAYYEDQKTKLRKSQLAIIKVCRKVLRKIKYTWETK